MTEKKEKKPKEDSLQKNDTQDSKKNQEQDNQEIIPEEILDAIPEEDRSRVASIIKQTMISGVMKRSNPIADKVTSDHITQLISSSDVQDSRDRKERKSERNYNLLLLVIGIIFVAFLIIFLQSNEDLLIKIVIAIISFIGGFGFGKTTSNNSNKKE